jgi:N-acetyl-anhydromuramyl-L-alanine amidase AmpD
MTAPFGIVLHHTGGSFQGDLATLTKDGTEVSANDYIDKRGRIFELCEFPKRA